MSKSLTKARLIAENSKCRKMFQSLRKKEKLLRGQSCRASGKGSSSTGAGKPVIREWPIDAEPFK